MDRISAIGELSALYAVAIRLSDAGIDGGVIAIALGIAPEDVPSLLDIAEAKLTRLEMAEISPVWQPVTNVVPRTAGASRRRETRGSGGTADDTT